MFSCESALNLLFLLLFCLTILGLTAGDCPCGDTPSDTLLMFDDGSFNQEVLSLVLEPSLFFFSLLFFSEHFMVFDDAVWCVNSL